MCTVTWLYDEQGGYTVFCSRDERRARAAAEPPRVAYRDGIRYLAPRDPEQGGTWISVNEAGLSLCLLNGSGGRGLISRGLLVSGIANSVSQDEALRRIRGAALTRFAAYQLAVWEPARPPLLIEWDGLHLTVIADANSHLPLTSSSVASDLVRRTRTALFQKERPASALALEAFHRSHEPGPGPYSVCMHRDDASTVSFTEITVREQTVSMAYYAGPPCARGPAIVQRLYVSLSADCAIHVSQ